MELSKLRRDLDKASKDLLFKLSEFKAVESASVQNGLNNTSLKNGAAKTAKDDVFAFSDKSMLQELFNEHILGIEPVKNNKNKAKSAVSEKNQEIVVPDKTNDQAYSLNQNSNISDLIDIFDFVDPDIKYALLASDYADAVLKHIEISKQNNNLPAVKELALKESLYALEDKNKLGRSYSLQHVSEPRYFQVAKSLEHLADLFSSLVSLHPKIKKNAAVNLCCMCFYRVSAVILEYSYAAIVSNSDLNKSDYADFCNKIVSVIDGVKTQITNEKAKNQPIRTIDICISKISAILREENILTSDEVEDINVLLKKLIEEVAVVEEQYIKEGRIAESVS